MNLDDLVGLVIAGIIQRKGQYKTYEFADVYHDARSTIKNLCKLYGLNEDSYLSGFRKAWMK